MPEVDSGRRTLHSTARFRDRTLGHCYILTFGHCWGKLMDMKYFFPVSNSLGDEAAQDFSETSRMSTQNNNFTTQQQALVLIVASAIHNLRSRQTVRRYQRKKKPSSQKNSKKITHPTSRVGGYENTLWYFIPIKRPSDVV